MSIIFAAALLALAQSPVSSDVGCLLDRLPVGERPQFVRDTLANVRSPATARLDAAIEACVADRGWSPDQAGTFAGWAAAILLRDDAAGQLRHVSLPVEAIDQWFDLQSEAVRTNPQLEEAVMETLIMSLVDQGVPEPVLEAQAETVGVYVGSRIMLERARLGLPLG